MMISISAHSVTGMVWTDSTTIHVPESCTDKELELSTVTGLI